MKTCSLKKNHQFRFVYNKGKSFANKYLVIFVLKNSSECNRLGISVSKKVGNSVIRNRIRRRIKESCRNMEPPLKTGHDIVILARQPSNNIEYKEFYNSIKYLIKKQNLLEE